jgi:hypothetical protein
VGANSNVVNARIFFCTELNCRWSSRDGVGGDGRVARYVHGSGPDGSSKSAGVPESTLRKSGRGLMTYFCTDLNCRVHSLGESGTDRTGRSLCVPSLVDRDPEIPGDTRIDRKKKWAGLDLQTDRQTDRQTVGV